MLNPPQQHALVAVNVVPVPVPVVVVISLFFLLLCQLLFLDTRPGLLLSLIQTGVISSIIPGHHDVLEIFVLSCLMFVSYDK